MQERKQSIKVARFCSLVYFASYITRLGIAAGLVEMAHSLHVSSSELGLACTAFFISYGVGQFLSGWLGDRVKPKLLISIGIGGSALSNGFLLFFPAPSVMTAICSMANV